MAEGRRKSDTEVLADLLNELIESTSSVQGDEGGPSPKQPRLDEAALKISLFNQMMIVIKESQDRIRALEETRKEELRAHNEELRAHNEWVRALEDQLRDKEEKIREKAKDQCQLRNQLKKLGETLLSLAGDDE